jgi:hypothetical protein
VIYEQQGYQATEIPTLILANNLFGVEIDQRAGALAAFALTITSLVGAVAIMIRWMVKHYLFELKPNSGSSLKDAVNRLESRIDDLYILVAEKNNKE